MMAEVLTSLGPTAWATLLGVALAGLALIRRVLGSRVCDRWRSRAGMERVIARRVRKMERERVALKRAGRRKGLGDGFLSQHLG